jgi:hypothetical protein
LFLTEAKCDITTRTPKQWMRSLREVKKSLGKERNDESRGEYNDGYDIDSMESDYEDEDEDVHGDGDLALISATPGQNDEDEIKSAASVSKHQDERVETPDLFRNSTLDMFEPGREEDSLSESNDSMLLLPFHINSQLISTDDDEMTLDSRSLPPPQPVPVAAIRQETVKKSNIMSLLNNDEPSVLRQPTPHSLHQHTSSIGHSRSYTPTGFGSRGYAAPPMRQADLEADLPLEALGEPKTIYNPFGAL